MTRLYSLLYITFLMFCVSGAKAQDTLGIRNVLLDNLLVKGNKVSPVKEMTDGSMLWEMSSMDDLPKILGNSDPIHYTQMLPGIGTNAEYQSGIHIQGCDNSHNIVSINGVPLYNVNHLLGFFSIFNASHFSTLNIRKSLYDVSTANRLGGGLDMETNDNIPDSTNGEFALGLISSQGTLRTPLGRRTSMTLSLRGSYINMLYGSWLKADKTQIEYSFYDCNFTLCHHIDDRNTVTIDFYAGNDTGNLNESSYLSDNALKWGNVMGSLRWKHHGHGFNVNQTIYSTYYHNKFMLTMQDNNYALKSSNMDLGYKGNITAGRWDIGLDAVWHNIQPQYLDNNNTYNVTSGNPERQHSSETSAFVRYSLHLRKHSTMIFGARATLYSAGGNHFGSADPSLAFIYDNSTVALSASCYLRHQYLFQTGFSSSGLPTEFWMSTGSIHRPQYAYGGNITASTYLADRKYRLSAELFYKRLHHQVEYLGNLLDFVNTEYNLDANLIHGNGTNCGFNVMLHKRNGNLKGWIAYTFTHSRRQFREFADDRKYPSNHERPHEINSIATYSLPRHWSFGFNLVFASGTPFTAPVSMEFINGNIVSQYGPYNGNRIKPYFRLDASANYKWKSRRGMEKGINISLYNVTCRSNDLFYRVKFKHNKEFAYRPLSFFIPILPSVSYFCKF